MSTMIGNEKVPQRLVQVHGARAVNLLNQHPKATQLFGKRYTPEWLLDHVAENRMELWDLRQDNDSVGLLAAYVSHAAVEPSYFVWCLYVKPKVIKGWDAPLAEWLKDRARFLGCSLVEWVTSRSPKAAERRAAIGGFKRAYTGFTLELEA